MKFQATAVGEWPNGIHWSPGEIRTCPDDYPGVDGDPPTWLKTLKKTKKKTATTKD